jgi:two-component system, NtrC family, sensor histidine kinase HydH
MALHSYPFRFQLMTILSSLLLLALGISVAWLVYSLSSASADVLGENIFSRQAAVNLEVSLNDLISRHHDGTKHINSLHNDIEAHMQVIDEYADKDEERILAHKLANSFRDYRALWNQLPKGRETSERLAQFLERETLPACRNLREYNARQVEESGLLHRETLRWLAWGLAAVGGFGSLAGLLMGYGLARGLSRTIHQLRIQVRDAADRLSQELPTVVLTPSQNDDPLHSEASELVNQVEQVVQKLQQREREVRRAERLAAVGQLAAGVAHEIRNPLTSIKMLIQAGREDPAAGLSEEDMQVIEREIRRLERSLQTFLDFARPPRLERRQQDLVCLIEQTLSLIRGRAEKQCVAIAWQRPPGPLRIEADGEQLQQVLVNLLLNALDALPHGGAIDLTVKPSGAWVEVSVRDSGGGISAELLPRLFEPFASGKETGLGLGLVVSRRIIEDHGGTLQAHNRPDGGAEFTFALPV